MSKPSGAWTTKLLTIGIAWFVAFLIAFALLSAFGGQMESLPHVVDALVFTGVLVPIMGLVVMPTVNAAVLRWERSRADVEHQRSVHR